MTDIKLPLIPDETFDAGGPIWGHILDWGAAEPGHAAGEHADAIDAAITRVMHEHAREAVRLNAQAVPEDLKEKLTDLIAYNLRGTWHCNRVWEAWYAGTMSQRDFEPVDESDTPAELADAVIAMLSAAPAAPQPAQPLDAGVMELAESVGLIGPASRTDDLHAAIQRFHDLIVVNASIKAALHFADGLAKPAQSLTDEKEALDLLNAENARLTKLVIELRAEAARMNAQAVPDGYALVPVDAMKRWRDAFAEELSAWDIDPPLHHVQTSHDEIETLLSAAPAAPQPAQPLTDEQIYGLYQRAGLEVYHIRDAVVQRTYDKCINDFARAIEQAHGIGVKP